MLTDIMKHLAPEEACNMLAQVNADLARILYLLVREVKAL